VDELLLFWITTGTAYLNPTAVRGEEGYEPSPTL